MQKSFSGRDKAIDYLFDNASEVSFAQTLQSGTQIGTITIDGNDTEIYAPAGSSVAVTPVALTGNTVATMRVGGTDYTLKSGDLATVEPHLSNNMKVEEPHPSLPTTVTVYEEPTVNAATVNNIPIYIPCATGIDYETRYTEGIIMGKIIVRYMGVNPNYDPDDPDSEQYMVVDKIPLELVLPPIGGSTVTWQQVQQSGTRIAVITIDGRSTDIYAPDGGSDVEANPSGAATDTLEKLRVGSTIYDLQNFIFLPTLYGTTEAEVGVWKDNKPLYQKTIITNADLTVVNSEYRTVPTTATFSGIGELVDAEYVSTTGAVPDAGVINFKMVSDVLKASSIGETVIHSGAVITVRYTKSADTPGSGTWSGVGVATKDDISALQASFQDGVDAIYDACVAKGSTPASHSLSDVVHGIEDIPTGGGGIDFITAAAQGSLNQVSVVTTFDATGLTFITEVS